MEHNGTNDSELAAENGLFPSEMDTRYPTPWILTRLNCKFLWSDKEFCL